MLLGVFSFVLYLVSGVSGLTQAQPNSDITVRSCMAPERSVGPAGTDAVAFQVVAQGLTVPWSLAFLPTGEWLVTERPGRLRVLRFESGRSSPTISEPILRLPVVQDGEGGMLGLVIDPNFATNRFVYLYVTIEIQMPNSTEDRVNRVLRYRLSEDLTRLTDEKVIVDNIPAAGVHNGGRLRFGPDGKLYVGTGDTWEANLSQDVSSLAGKILRYNSDGSIPSDNPFPGKAAYIIGIRNTQGFDWVSNSSNTPLLAVADHGPSGEFGRTGHDEVNIATPGANLGWPTTYACQASPGLTAPILTWVSAQAPGGLSVYRGNLLPNWRGDIVVGMLRSQRIHRIKLGFESRSVGILSHESYFSGRPDESTGASTFGRIREVITGPDNELYVTTSNCDGRGRCPSTTRDMILKLVPR